LRLGRVLGLRGRHAEAAAELDRALPSLRDDRLRYYAHLFLGEELAALGRRDAARASYDRAVALFPSAQSARFALSALARRHGDRRTALASIREVLGLPADESSRPDPWWQYHYPVRSDADASLAGLYAAWPKKGQP
jgi:tetratricopeptide (TPR) repeat protein